MKYVQDVVGTKSFTYRFILILKIYIDNEDEKNILKTIKEFFRDTKELRQKILFEEFYFLMMFIIKNNILKTVKKEFLKALKDKIDGYFESELVFKKIHN
jgi:hypothetical protein